MSSTPYPRPLRWFGGSMLALCCGAALVVVAFKVFTYRTSCGPSCTAKLHRDWGIVDMFGASALLGVVLLVVAVALFCGGLIQTWRLSRRVMR